MEKPKVEVGQRWANEAGRVYTLLKHPTEAGMFQRRYDDNGALGNFSWSAEETLRSTFVSSPSKPLGAPTLICSPEVAERARKILGAPSVLGGVRAVAVGQRYRVIDKLHGMCGRTFVVESIHKGTTAGTRWDDGKTGLWEFYGMMEGSVELISDGDMDRTLTEMGYVKAMRAAPHPLPVLSTAPTRQTKLCHDVAHWGGGKTIEPCEDPKCLYRAAPLTEKPAREATTGRIDGKSVMASVGNMSCLQLIRAKKPPEPYICPVDDWDLLPGVDE